ncbi:MAG: glycosyltransferase, partial [Planctomycetota bacterium]
GKSVAVQDRQISAGVTAPSPVLIALPDGLAIGGVVTWAVRLTAALAEAGRACMLLLHDKPAGRRALPETAVGDGVLVHRLAGLPRLDEASGDLSPWLDAYAEAAERLAAHHLRLHSVPRPTVAVPNLLGDCAGLVTALAISDAQDLRLLLVDHSDIAYNAAVCRHYAEAASGFVGVSAHLADRLGRLAADRTADVRGIAHGVAVPETLPVRAPLDGRRLELMYTGRLENEAKRVSVLPMLSAELERRGVRHRLTLIGDGPAEDAIDEACAHAPDRLRRLLPRTPAGIIAELDRADAFVLASRYEGLSVSLIEALSRGCVPIVTATRSGSAELVEPGVSGELATADGSDGEVAVALADAVQRALTRGVAQMSEAAHRRAQRHFSIGAHAAAWGEAIDAASAKPRPTWPIDRPIAFTADGVGAVPSDAAARMAEVLAGLAGRRVMIHGTGRHTRSLLAVIEDSPAEVVGFADDNPDAAGGTLAGRPVRTPSDIENLDATDVVLSSALHEDELWHRRAVYERAGLRVHRLYGA